MLFAYFRFTVGSWERLKVRTHLLTYLLTHTPTHLLIHSLNQTIKPVNQINQQ